MGEMGMAQPSKSDEKKKMYPSFHYEGTEPLDLPESGEMTIRFTKKAEEKRKTEDGKTRYSCTVEVNEIVDMDGEDSEAPAKGGNKESEDALDRLALEKSKKKSDEEEY